MKYNPAGYYTSEILDDHGIRHGFGTRKYDPSPPVGEGRGEGEKHLVIPKTKQIHSNTVAFLDSVDPHKTYIGDGWLTSRPEIICFVRTADCLPLLIFDPIKKIVGAIHCGRRSVESQIIGKTISLLEEKGNRPKNIIAAIGPHICKDCYETNLLDIVKDELIGAGVKGANIDSANLCTLCNSDKFYSYRKDRSEKGRQINFICVRRGSGLD